jgi:TRAP-type C4-dicarboxylate transport system permease small subunit
MIWLTFVGAGPVLRYGGHIAIDNLQDALPRAFAVALRIVVALLLGGFFGFMVWYGVLYMQRTQFQTTAATQISFAYVYAAMPVGGGLLLVHWLLIVRGFVRGRVFAVDADFDAQAAASL